MSGGLISLEKIWAHPPIWRAHFFESLSETSKEKFLGGLGTSKLDTVVVYQEDGTYPRMDFTSGGTKGFTFSTGNALKSYCKKYGNLIEYSNVVVTNEVAPSHPERDMFTVLERNPELERGELRVVLL